MIDFLNQKTISISILDVDKLDVFLDKLNKFKEEQNLDNIVIHFDVMDNKFVPNTGIDLSEIKIVKKYGFFVDVHLMCTNPKSYIDKACFYGADNITIHYEIDNLYENLDYLNNFKVTFRTAGASRCWTTSP